MALLPFAVAMADHVVAMVLLAVEVTDHLVVVAIADLVVSMVLLVPPMVLLIVSAWLVPAVLAKVLFLLVAQILPNFKRRPKLQLIRRSSWLLFLSLPRKFLFPLTVSAFLTAAQVLPMDTLALQRLFVLPTADLLLASMVALAQQNPLLLSFVVPALPMVDPVPLRLLVLPMVALVLPMDTLALMVPMASQLKLKKHPHPHLSLNLKTTPRRKLQWRRSISFRKSLRRLGKALTLDLRTLAMATAASMDLLLRLLPSLLPSLKPSLHLHLLPSLHPRLLPSLFGKSLLPSLKPRLLPSLFGKSLLLSLHPRLLPSLFGKALRTTNWPAFKSRSLLIPMVSKSPLRSLKLNP